MSQELQHDGCHDEWSPRRAAQNFLVHLRLPYQLTLAPFMLWGAALAHAALSGRFVAAFVILHVCFYGGTTAYNSHFDRDEGPVGGMEMPPKAGPWLHHGSLALQAVGLVGAAAVAVPFLAVCVAFCTLGILYSHPATRWKGHPWLSWATVVVGQGCLGTAAGLSVFTGVAATAEIGFGLAAAGTLAGALYPLTQLFQTDEDRARGDRTLAITLGHRGTQRTSIGLSVLGALLMAASAWAGGRAFDAGLFAVAALPMGAGAAWVCATEDPRRIFQRISRLQMIAGIAFGLYAAIRVVGGS